MGYGHAERNLALIRQLEAETRELLGTLDRPDPEQSAWLREVASLERQAGKAGLLQGWWVSGLTIMKASPRRHRVGRTKHASGACEGVSSSRDG
jgi:hypothetical protein